MERAREVKGVKRQTALILNCILLVGCLSYFFLKPLFMGPIQYKVLDEEEKTLIEKMYTRAEEPFFTELAFSGEKLPFDKTTSTFYLPLNMNVEAWETGELTSMSKEIRLAFEDNFTKESKQEAICQGTAFRFYAIRGQEYQECYLVATGIPILSIETTETADTGAFGGMVYYWDSQSKRDWTGANILEAHIRGNTSRTYPKKGYKLTLKTQDKSGNVVSDKKSLFGLRTDDEWILNAMYSDASKIRDKLSADLWNGFGAKIPEFPNAKFGTDFVYVEVFFNQEYWGLYGLMEPVDSKQLDLAKEGDGAQVEYSYKSVIPQELPTEELLETSLFGEELAGYELKGSYSRIDKAAWEPLLSYLKLRDLENDEEFSKNAPDFVDVDGALNVWTYLQAVIGIDNRGKNMYYVAKSNGKSYRIYFAPWDMDLTWGDCLREGTGEAIWDVELGTGLYSERVNWSFGDRLIELDVEDAREQVEIKWKQLREGLLSDDNLTDAVDNLTHEVQDSGALLRDKMRWPDSNFGADYELFKRMALYRMKILDYYFDGNLEAYMGLGFE